MGVPCGEPTMKTALPGTRKTCLLRAILVSSLSVTGHRQLHTTLDGPQFFGELGVWDAAAFPSTIRISLLFSVGPFNRSLSARSRSLPASG